MHLFLNLEFQTKVMPKNIGFSFSDIRVIFDA
jgi:hypothetical protein